ncbi:MAG: DNA internalization-related competence protein ComEC/Rec2 [Candidatus Aminicenantes bacterium]|nr:DNA internalization-related competence protein ComEC/Rec2 [Candidatus Aminicenantes bacterium]
MAYPLLFPTIAFIAGLAAAAELSPSPAAVLGPAVFALAAAWFCYSRRWTRIAFLCLLAASAAAGAGALASFDRAYEQNPLRHLPRGEYFDWTGTAFRSPEPGLDNDFIYIQAESVEARGEIHAVSGRLRISVGRSDQGAHLPEIVAGDRLRISAQIVPPAEYRNFRKSFTPAYLKSRKIHALASAKSPLLVQRLGPGRIFPPLRWISRLRRTCLSRIDALFAIPGRPGGLSSVGAVISALVLGERSRMDPETTRTLQKSGLYHLFAISGAHIALISALLFGLFRTLRLKERPSYLLLLLVLVFFGFFVEGRASVVRAVIMAVAFIAGKLLWRDVHLLNTIAASALAILLVRPTQALEAGFQLTFVATLGLILFFRPVRNRLPPLPSRIGDLLALSIAAQAAVMPIMAAVFHRVIFSGLILNFIGVPLVIAIMAAGYVVLPAVFLFPFLAQAAAAALSVPIRLLLSSAGWLDGLPFLSYRIPTPPWPVIAAYYGFLLLLLLPKRFVLPRRIGGAGFAAALVALSIYPFPARVKDLTVTVLDVGQGEAILVEFPGKEKMLIDAGGLPTDAFDTGENVVSPVLWDKGIKKIDVLVLSHAHPDHLNGLPTMARNFRVGEFWEGTPAPENPRYLDLLKALGPAPRFRVLRGFRRTVGGVEILAVAPAASIASGESDNDSSVVLRLVHGTTAALLTGDIGRTVEADILASGEDIRSQVLKAPHHGSNSSSSEEFLAAVGPENAVISAGRGNHYGLPHPDVLSRYERLGARIFRTDLHGAVEFRSDGRRWAVRTSVR